MNKRKGLTNILAVYSLATEADIRAGKAWYEEARSFCEKMAAKHDVTIDVAIATLSALSPRNKWAQNLKDVDAVLTAAKAGLGPETVRVGTFGANKAKAFRIIFENAPHLALTSNKTAAFFDNIHNPESMKVTVDIHAFSIFFGFRAEPSTLTNTHYEILSAAYRLAAKRVGLRPYEMQACCWLAWKRTTAKHRVRKVRPSEYGDIGRFKVAA